MLSGLTASKTQKMRALMRIIIVAPVRICVRENLAHSVVSEFVELGWVLVVSHRSEENDEYLMQFWRLLIHPNLLYL